MNIKDKIKKAEIALLKLSEENVEASITIKNIPKEELKTLAKDYKKSLFEPSTMSPYYWFSIPMPGNEDLKLYCRTASVVVKTEFVEQGN